MYKLLAKIGLIVALCVQVPVWSQDGKVKVSVFHSGEDSVGKQFAYAVREAIRGSNGYQLVSSDQSGIDVRIITVDPDRSSGSSWTVAAVTYTMTNFIPYQTGNPQTWYPIYLTSLVMTVGSSRTDAQARSVMAAIDEQLERYRRDARK
jgi:hypothetical protein